MPHVVRSAALGACLGLVLIAAAPSRASLLADSISVSGDSISRGFNANTSSCNYGDNVSRAWATGDDHGGSFCGAGGTTFSHAERLECAKGGNVTNFNDAASGADMLNDFFTQSVSIKLNLSSSPAPRYVPVFMGHNDICTNTENRTGNSCSGDQDPDNYCRTTAVAFEREFRRGMDQLIQIPSARIGIMGLVRVSELCNFTSKNGCGLTFGVNCSTVWGIVDICASLTKDCSNQRRIDAYDTMLVYNEILERVTAEYVAIPTGGTSSTGAIKAPDVQIRFGRGSSYYKFVSSDVSCCDCFHPADQGQAKIAQFVWDGLQCSAGSQCCTDTGDPLTDARCDVVDTTTFYPGGFWPGGMPCGNGIVDPGEQCDDGNALDGDCCSSTCQLDPAGTSCAGDGNPCTDDVCDAAGACTHPANTASCDDGQFCTVSDQCSGGSCGGTPRGDCSSVADQCNTGVCDEGSDACVPQPVGDGTGCSDGNACTAPDTCQAGTCAPGTAVVCGAADQCHLAGTCNPLSGTCSNPPKPDGSGCDDGNACTQTDACQAGLCAGASPVTCTASDQCHLAGTCDPGTGTCSNPAKTDGSGCDDGNACTQLDACQAGACSGANPVVCATPDQCHDAGVCDPGSGVCSNPVKPDGTACSDGSACTQTDTCQAGACSGANPVVCTAQDQCHDVGTCDPGTGTCSNPSRADGATCNDGNACTQVDSCQAGACAGANPVVCPTPDQCHDAGACDPGTGVCSNPAKADGTTCSDGSACTQTDTCQGGACSGGNPVTCTAQDQCHDAGTCDPGTGTCSNPTKADGVACSDGDACTQSDTCEAGACAGANPVVCPGADECHGAGVCDPGTGNCASPPFADGTGCNDGDACTQADACQGGVCTGTDPVVCAPADACHEAGECDPGTGTCSTPSKADGTACNDGDACSVADACTGGVCQGGPACGDGLVQAGCGEQCDLGAANGGTCCSAACQVVDGDADGVCDRDDPCTGGAAIARQKLVLARLDTPPGDDKLTFKGEFVVPFPFAPALNPAAHGVRLLIEGTGGALLDATIPPGIYAGTTGWKTNGTGTSFTYLNRGPAPPGGITRLQVKNRSASTPGLVQVRAKGKGGYPATAASLPVRVIVVLDAPTALGGQCGTASFPGPRPVCSFNASGAKLTCR